MRTVETSIVDSWPPRGTRNSQALNQIEFGTNIEPVLNAFQGGDFQGNGETVMRLLVTLATVAVEIYCVPLSQGPKLDGHV